MIYATFYIGLVLVIILIGAYRQHRHTWGEDKED